MNEGATWVISDQARDSLRKCELFRDLNTKQLMEVAALVEEHALEPDELLLREGDAARYLYVVVEGRAVAQLEMYRGWLSLGIVAPPDAAGWASLVGARVHPASVKALTPLRVARIETKGLTLLMDLEPAIGYPVNKRLNSVFWHQYQAALEAFKSGT